ncbi:hypothetical protein NDU88_004280 [Pleurodeles waltl]|uniref:Myb/SANT-like DNA-binding domain-containing protein n=1 Tax=Pleurodeles waltl TaxID=8319 RepID=A0AAV7M754_PLEWA|nr:hypothetical protein NDU88_004280 [Pleurodeles waltl]
MLHAHFKAALHWTQVQHTSIAREMELWQRIVDRVNAVGQHPRNRDDIRKWWNDLRGKVRSMVSRHNIAVQKTGGGPPPTPPEFTAWEEEVLHILHPEGLAGVSGGMDSGPERHHTAQEGPEMSIPPPEEATSDDSSSVFLDPDDQPGPSGTSGQSVPVRQPLATADPTPSGNTSTAPTQRAHASVSRTRQSAVCSPLQGTQVNPPPQQQQGPGGSGSGHTVQGTEAQGIRGTGRAAVRQGGTGPGNPLSTRPSPPSWEHTTTPRRRWRRYWPGSRRSRSCRSNSTWGSGKNSEASVPQWAPSSGELNQIVTTLRDHVAPKRAPVTSMDQEQATTSAGASGQEAPTQQQATRTPPPAEEEPPRKRGLRSRKKTE